MALDYTINNRLRYGLPLSEHATRVDVGRVRHLVPAVRGIGPKALATIDAWLSDSEPEAEPEVGEPMSADADRFRVVLADPPWPFKDRLPGPGRGAVKHYRCLSVAELCAFPLPPLEQDCTLFLWRVAAMPQEALDVMTAWGFTPKSEIVWVKRTRAGTLHLGMGHTVRMTHESCLVGVRGHPVTRSRKIPSVFFARRRNHSVKPTRFYDVVESLRDGPYVELFARQRRAGWTSLGDQVPVQEEEPSQSPSGGSMAPRDVWIEGEDSP